MSENEELVKSVKSVLNKINHPFNFDEDKDVFTLWYNLPSAKIEPVPMHIFVSDSRLISLITCSETAENCIPEMAEFLVRANSSLDYGCFEMDCDEGYISFVSIIPEYATITEGTILKYAIVLPLTNMDKFSGGIVSVMNGEQSPKDAYDECMEIEIQVMNFRR